jgi:hypothetical protein
MRLLEYNVGEINVSGAVESCLVWYGMVWYGMVKNLTWAAAFVHIDTQSSTSGVKETF